MKEKKCFWCGKVMKVAENTQTTSGTSSEELYKALVKYIYFFCDCGVVQKLTEEDYQ